MPGRRVIFLSTMEGAPWGGSEELWSQTAIRMAADGFGVTACVRAWDLPHSRIDALLRAGVDMHMRPAGPSLLEAALRRLRRTSRGWSGTAATQRLLADVSPELVVISEGANFPPIDLLEAVAPRYRFVTVGHNNADHWWPEDALAARLRAALSRAERCYFVSEGNRQLAETQLGEQLPNAAIIRNPCKVTFDVAVPWPSIPADQELALACVGRLDPRAKGQDLLIAALAGSVWATRQWRLTLYGDGPMRDTLQRLVTRAGLQHRVTFAGQIDRVEDIWSRNHVLVQPSRHEGLPLTVVEAMLCGRPVLATDIAGHAEIVLEGVTGMLADAPTPHGMAAALERLWQQRAELRSLGLNAATTIRSMMPRDPAAEFANALSSLLTAA